MLFLPHEGSVLPTSPAEWGTKSQVSREITEQAKKPSRAQPVGCRERPCLTECWLPEHAGQGLSGKQDCRKSQPRKARDSVLSPSSHALMSVTLVKPSAGLASRSSPCLIARRIQRCIALFLFHDITSTGQQSCSSGLAAAPLLLLKAVPPPPPPLLLLNAVPLPPPARKARCVGYGLDACPSCLDMHLGPAMLACKRVYYHYLTIPRTAAVQAEKGLELTGWLSAEAKQTTCPDVKGHPFCL